MKIWFQFEYLVLSLHWKLHHQLLGYRWAHCLRKWQAHLRVGANGDVWRGRLSPRVTLPVLLLRHPVGHINAAEQTRRRVTGWEDNTRPPSPAWFKTDTSLPEHAMLGRGRGQGALYCQHHATFTCRIVQQLQCLRDWAVYLLHESKDVHDAE